MKAFVLFLIFTYYMTVLIGTVVLIQGYGWSPWWIVLAILLGIEVKFKD